MLTLWINSNGNLFSDHLRLTTIAEGCAHLFPNMGRGGDLLCFRPFCHVWASLSHTPVTYWASHDLISWAVDTTVSISEMGQRVCFNFRPLHWWSYVWLVYNYTETQRSVRVVKRGWFVFVLPDNRKYTFFSCTGCGIRHASVSGRGEGWERVHIIFFLSILWKVWTGASKIYGLIFNLILYLPVFLFISTFGDALREEKMELEETEVDTSPSWYDFFTIINSCSNF